MSLALRSAPFRHVPLRALRRPHVEHWVKAMTGPRASTGDDRTRYNNVRSVLKGAVADGVLAADPSAGVPLPRARKRDAAMSIPTPADVGALPNAADEGFGPSLACTYESERVVHLPDQVVELLSAHVAAHPPTPWLF